MLQGGKSGYGNMLLKLKNLTFDTSALIKITIVTKSK